MFHKALKQLAPRVRLRSLEWCKLNVQTDAGRPYDHGAYPHLGAPGGPFDAFDDPAIKTIWLQFASRLGKTFFGNCCLMNTAATAPAPLMFASADQKMAVEVVARVYAMLERCRELKNQLRPKQLQNRTRIDLEFCKCFVAWSRSVSTLADKAVRVGQANEIDKWLHQSTSKEADPLKLFDDRFKEFPTHKKIKESTPTVKGASRIESGRLQSTNCSFYVPCPKCQRYQLLKMDRIKWSKLENGRSDKELARTSAWYDCQYCEKLIENHLRSWSMRRGVWCPEGSTVNSERAAKLFGEGGRLIEDYRWQGWQRAIWIDGKPLRDGLDAGYQLSSLYALSLEWGDIAAEFVACKDKPQDLRNYINQWLGETWEIVRQQQTWEQLGKRIISTTPPSVVPEWASLLTIGIDRQQDDGAGRFPWVVDAWGPEQRVATIAYGQAFSFDELFEVVSKKWSHADGHAELGLSFGLFDTGYLPRDIDEFCLRCNRAGLRIYQCKGSNIAMRCDWEYSILGKNTARPGMAQYMVDTIRSQLWIEAQLAAATKDDDAGYSLYKGALWEHQDFLEQLLNDASVEKLDSANNVRQGWERINTNVPNDFRACRRYSRAAMLVTTRNGPVLPRGFKPIHVIAEQPESRIRPLRMRSRE